MTTADLYQHSKAYMESEIAIIHLFVGEINSIGNTVGFHLESNLAAGVSQIKPGTKTPPDSHNVYEGKIIVHNVDRDKKSTFFPEDWSPIKVLDEIEQAYNKKIQILGSQYEGETLSGLILTFYLNSSAANGKVRTVYPQYRL